MAIMIYRMGYFIDSMPINVDNDNNNNINLESWTKTKQHKKEGCKFCVCVCVEMVGGVFKVGGLMREASKWICFFNNFHFSPQHRVV